MKDVLKGRKTLKVSGVLDELEKDAVIKGADIVSLFASFNVALTRKGKSYMGRCPWHDDKTPSLSVDAVKKLYHCFGCGESGDVITLVEKMKGCTFPEALDYLRNGKPTAENEPRVEPDTGHPRERTEGKNPPDGIKRTEKAPAGESSITLNDICTYYRTELLSSKGANAYLEKRGLSDPVMLTRFGAGFAGGTILSKLSVRQKAECVTAGILSDKGREHFYDCIVFPITDEQDRVTGMYGRTIADTREPKHLYLKGAHRGIFNRTVSKVYDEIILTESIIDALSLIALGIENVQSIYGTNGFTDEHLQTLKDDRVKRITLALDNDESGRTASAKLKERLLGEGFAVKEIFPPREIASAPRNDRDPVIENKVNPAIKDWNEYLVQGGTADTIKSLIASAELYAPTDAPLVFRAQSENAIRITRDGLYYTAQGADITYRVSGVKDIFAGSLRVAIKAASVGSCTSMCPPTLAPPCASFVDTLELYSARARASFAMNLSKACGVESSRIEKDLISILEYFEAERDRRLSHVHDEAKEELTAEERDRGLSLLKNPNLFDRIVRDMDMLGYVGEEVNKKMLYLSASSRILDDPLSVLILSQSASGKSFLVDTVKKLMPPEDVIAVTSLSDQALNYVDDLLHKFLILGEAVHSDSVEHQIREMLSGKELSRLVTLKDEKSGVMKSQVVRRPVIVSAVMSGTNYAINPENASRCFVIAADESREQTKRIHSSQREKYSLERYAEKENDVPEIIRTHHAAQRMLKRIRVINPFAKHLNFPDSLMRTRRDHDRFMDLIACVAFVRQYQKDEKRDTSTGSVTGMEYIECDMKDYEIAYEIMLKGVLSTTMNDTPRGVIDFYESLRRYAKEKASGSGIETHEASFTQREIRERTGLSQTWVKTQMRILLDYEYLVILRGGASRSKGVYRIREDRHFEEVNLAMIPSPDEMKRICTQTGQLV